MPSPDRNTNTNTNECRQYSVSVVHISQIKSNAARGYSGKRSFTQELLVRKRPKIHTFYFWIMGNLGLTLLR